MKNVVGGPALLLALGAVFAFRPAAEDKAAIKWYTWEEAVAANAKQPKKLFVDVYTDWCGWCKRMDATTFADPAVAAYINENFYAVKLNAEQREDINYDNQVLRYREAGRRGIHELAYALLDGRLSYPSYVYLNEKEERITISPGFKEPAALMKELKYIAEDHFKTTKFEDFQP